jgi:signal transduction histidine kinase
MKLSAIPRAVELCCAITVLISTLALTGWSLEWHALKEVIPGFLPMNPLTATTLLIASASLWLQRDPAASSPWSGLGALLGGVVAAIALSRIANYAFGVGYPIDQMMFASTIGVSRMTPNTALCAWGIGTGLLLARYRMPNGFWPGQIFAMFTTMICTACMLGYAYGAETMTHASAFVPMPLNSTTALLTMAIGTLLLQPRDGVIGLLLAPTAGGAMARTMLPAAVVIPLLVGAMRLAGEEAGLYDPRFGTAINVTMMMGLLLLAVSLAGSSLTRSDAARRKAADDLAQANRDLEARINERTEQLADANAQLVTRSTALEGANQSLQQRSTQLAKLNLQLNHRQAELATINADLVQKNEENEMFVYSVSHDLRSPLVNLQGFSNELKATLSELQEMLEKPQAPPAEERRRRILGEDMPQSIHFIQTAVTRLSGIIDALLRLSRAGRVDYQPQVVDVTAMTHRVIESMSGTIFDRGAEVTVDALPPVYGDPTAVEQVFANLIGNAVNYLDPNRPGKITIGSRPAEQPAGDGADWTTFFVSDNGLGIAEAYHAKVFQALKRLHPQAAKGEGIGLAIVRRIVERHGGIAWFESTAGVGSTFFINLPTSAPADRAVDACASCEPQERGSYVERSA